MIDLLNELGYVDPQSRELDQRWFTSLAEPVLDVLDALGLWRAGGRRRDVPATAAVRAIAIIEQVILQLAPRGGLAMNRWTHPTLTRKGVRSARR
ncbi:MAG TPA: hypothetical protein DCR63_04380 [Microbacterium sp.]|nr:hypothetical protein [Microbacterium sp.]